MRTHAYRGICVVVRAKSQKASNIAVFRLHNLPHSYEHKWVVLKEKANGSIQ